MSQSIENMTLRNKVNETEKIIRELIHHVEHGFIPKAHVSRRMARRGKDPKEEEIITDVTVREAVSKMLEADDFTTSLCGQMSEFLKSIEQDLNRAIGNE